MFVSILYVWLWTYVNLFTIKRSDWEGVAQSAITGRGGAQNLQSCKLQLQEI